MSFLKGLGGSLAGLGGGQSGVPQVNPASPPNAAASGLRGPDSDAEINRIRALVDRVGLGANQIATAGGAQPGYTSRGLDSDAEARLAALRGSLPGREINSNAEINNHMQLLDPNVLQALIQRFGGQQR